MKNVLEVKNARLEVLESKMTKLEALEVKLARLEERDVQQELLIKAMQKEKYFSVSNREISVGKSTGFPRTCREVRASDPSLSSGMYWIDPDGQGIGDDPIHVFCDMAKGIVNHFIIEL